MKVVIGGDFYISDRYKGKDLVDNSIINLFQGADLKIVNLEAPITDDSSEKIIKTGPHLHSTIDTLESTLGQLSINLVTLANNHIMDYGSIGFTKTINELNRLNIAFVGGGINSFQASKPYSFEVEDIKIAILNFCESEWSVAKMDFPGSNPLDIIDNIKQIKSAKETHDKVLVIIHGGHEYFPLPSPRMVKQYRFYAENGADIIIGHHTHCFSGYEIYNDVPIFYSLGNFLFTLESSFNSWYTGLLLEIIFNKNVPIQFKLHPTIMHKESFHLSLANEKKLEGAKSQIKKYNEILSNSQLLSHEWEKFLNLNFNHYANTFNPINFIQNRVALKLLYKAGLSRLFIRKRHFAYLLNSIRCEAHRDASINILEKYITK